jgi:hypothetical protein
MFTLFEQSKGVVDIEDHWRGWFSDKRLLLDTVADVNLCKKK